MLDVAALYEHHWPMIFGFLRNRMPYADRAEVEDLAALVFERVLRVADRYEEDARIRSWLIVIARNLLIDSIRVQQSKPPGLEMLSDALGGHCIEDAGSERHLTELDVAEAMMQLSPRQRMVLVEQHWMGGTVHESALMLGISEDAVKKMRDRAKRKLRALLAA